jgi:glycine hydroxymethyltransferase
LADDLAARLRASLRRQESLLRSSLILNPVENVPFEEDLAVVAGPLHGLYNTDKVRTRERRLATDMQFAGRQALEADARDIYDAWAKALHAEDVSFRVLSGLHAHIILFMAMAEPGQTVLLLPVRAGGHVSAKPILERLGLKTIDMVVDDDGLRVDVDATLDLCEASSPDFVMVDRSEGLVYEDFSRLATTTARRSIFDASQYLTNIICGDLPNPFGWGFDLLVASVHKNFPGPQKALIATRTADTDWLRLLGGVSTYVSNMHSASTYVAGLTLARRPWLAEYSQRMLEISVGLEDELHECGVPVVRRPRDLAPTHHLWIRERDRETAFETYERLEQCLIMTNFRLLPYGLGHGLRLGVSAAVRVGLTADDVPRLAALISDIRGRGATAALKREAREFNESIWERGWA